MTERITIALVPGDKSIKLFLCRLYYYSDEELQEFAYEKLYETIKHYLPKLSEEEIKTAMRVFLGTCHRCYQAEAGCQCWNDE